MAPPASKEADEAVEMLLNGTALTAKQAMQYTGKFNEKDMNDDNKQSNIRKRAKRDYEKRLEANPQLPSYTKST